MKRLFADSDFQFTVQRNTIHILDFLRNVIVELAELVELNKFQIRKTLMRLKCVSLGNYFSTIRNVSRSG